MDKKKDLKVVNNAQVSSNPACDSTSYPGCLSARSAGDYETIPTPIYPNSAESPENVWRRAKLNQEASDLRGDQYKVHLVANKKLPDADKVIDNDESKAIEKEVGKLPDFAAKKDETPKPEKEKQDNDDKPERVSAVKEAENKKILEAAEGKKKAAEDDASTAAAEAAAAKKVADDAAASAAAATTKKASDDAAAKKTSLAQIDVEKDSDESLSQMSVDLDSKEYKRPDSVI